MVSQKEEPGSNTLRYIGLLIMTSKRPLSSRLTTRIAMMRVSVLLRAVGGENVSAASDVTRGLKKSAPEQTIARTSFARFVQMAASP